MTTKEKFMRLKTYEPPNTRLSYISNGLYNRGFDAISRCANINSLTSLARQQRSYGMTMHKDPPLFTQSDMYTNMVSVLEPLPEWMDEYLNTYSLIPTMYEISSKF